VLHALFFIFHIDASRRILVDHDDAARPAATHTPKAHGGQAHSEGHDADEHDPEPFHRQKAEDLLNGWTHVVLAIASPIPNLAHGLGTEAIRSRINQLAKVDDADRCCDTLSFWDKREREGKGERGTLERRFSHPFQRR